MMQPWNADSASSLDGKAPGGGQSEEERASPVVEARNAALMADKLLAKSRFLSRVLRHRPDSVGITLDRQGWASVRELLDAAAAHGMPISRDELECIVSKNDKQRFTFSPDKTRVRAAQGHSVAVDLQLPVRTPPPALYHGTVRKFLASIRRTGLLPGTRRDVHLSETKDTAAAVGARRGIPVVLVVETYPMLKAGVKFRRADNGVWLVPAVPPEYIRFPS